MIKTNTSLPFILHDPLVAVLDIVSRGILGLQYGTGPRDRQNEGGRPGFVASFVSFTITKSLLREWMTKNILICAVDDGDSPPGPESYLKP